MCNYLLRRKYAACLCLANAPFLVSRNIASHHIRSSPHFTTSSVCLPLYTFHLSLYQTRSDSSLQPSHSFACLTKDARPPHAPTFPHPHPSCPLPHPPRSALHPRDPPRPSPLPPQHCRSTRLPRIKHPKSAQTSSCSEHVSTLIPRHVGSTQGYVVQTIPISILENVSNIIFHHTPAPKEKKRMT